MRKRRIKLSTYRHLGDTVCLGAAIRNLELSHGDEFEVWHESDYGEIFRGWRFVHVGSCPDAQEIRIVYGKKSDENRARNGSFPQAFTGCLAEQLGVEIPCRVLSMPLMLTEDEKRKYAELCGCIILNTGVQTCSMTKRYPHWPEVAQLLSQGDRVVLVGGSESRDVRFEGEFPEGVVDLRGQTSIRDFCSLIYVAKGVISPPSGCVHIAAALETPCLCISGAKEPEALTAYPMVEHISSRCGAYNGTVGCGHMFSCEGQIRIGGELYPQCFASVTPELVAGEALKLFGEFERW